MTLKKFSVFLQSAMARFLQNVFFTCVLLTFMALVVITNSIKSTPLPEPLTSHAIKSSVLPSNRNITQWSAYLPYLKNPTTICDSFKTFDGIKILVLVKSSPENFHLRSWIRYKADKNQEFKDSVRTVFLLGQSGSRDKDILKESQVHGDIVQGSFVDAYRNLTLKTIMGYRWLSEHCANSDYVVYKDDDFRIHFGNLIKQFKAQKNKDSIFIGHLVQKGKMIYRDPKHKWYLSKEDYPKNILPPYFPGGAYVVSTSIARKLASNFEKVKIIPIDDVYIGLVAQTLTITLTHSKLFGVGNCDNFQKNIACREFSKPDEVLDAWKTMTVYNLEKTKT